MQWFIIGGAALLLLVLAGWFWLSWPKRQMRSITAADPKARADIEDNFRKTVGQALGGIAVLIGAGIAYYGTQQTLQVNEDQARRSREAAQTQFSQQQEAAQKQFSQQQQAAHELLISNQVAKGFEQLASDKIAMRLGGIYALEGVMNTSEQYHQPVLEALCAFVRENTRSVKDEPPATDIQAALTVIGRRSAGAGRVDLAGAHIPKAILINVNLTGADLVDANLSGANLSGADLTGANLPRAKLTITYSRGANLTGAELGGADLASANLRGANLSGADLSAANLTGAGLTDAKLTGANLWYASLNLVDLTHVDLTRANLTKASLSGAILSDADLTRADFSDADLRRAVVSQSQLDTACGNEPWLDPGLSLKRC
jgi:uncharacterized protein YjbI with pentapeptide repeats